MCSEYTIDFSFVRETSRSRGKFREMYFYKEMDETHDKYLRKKKGNDDAVLTKYGRELCSVNGK